MNVCLYQVETLGLITIQDNQYDRVLLDQGQHLAAKSMLREQREAGW